MSTDLIAFESIQSRLELTNDLSEIREVRDKAEAVRAYAKNAQLGLALQNRAAELKLRAERKAGQSLARLRLRGGDRKSKSRARTISLQELGITKSQSARWQLEASVPEQEFRDLVAAANAQQVELTSSSLIRLAQSLNVSHKPPRPHTQSRAKSPLPPAEIGSTLQDLRNHQDVLRGILAPLTAGQDTSLKRGEAKGVGYLLRQMELLLDQIETYLSSRSPVSQASEPVTVEPKRG